ncbi:hypothetical protein MGH68_12570 [Erysipelothrix sp. D19-032]
MQRINKNQFNKSVENKKEFPRSIVINGVKGAEGAPTSLHWDVVFNNNKLIRQPNDGFNFYLDASKVKAYDYNGSEIVTVRLMSLTTDEGQNNNIC